MVGRLWSAQPSIGMGLELDVIASVVLGGTSLFGSVGSIVGTMTGILIMGFLDNGLRLLEISSYLQQVIKGAVFVGAVALDMYFKDSYRKDKSRDALLYPFRQAGRVFLECRHHTALISREDEIGHLL
ncbi:MAG TPA: hypothetical protein DDW96_03360 [Synergistaceae bacterium]|jgi:ribose/xylose/arabinose/galactoside ABC-type transport system permease subunit|nr:MAG: Ribose ABC transporter permease protein [Synergistales bacterium 57_84]KUK86485.1 MAG: Ribose ABC transporter permease protein [Synergistales bacterium 58_81]HBG14353.1 hypothetical protein [Synergistaceae bacterium]